MRHVIAAALRLDGVASSLTRRLRSCRSRENRDRKQRPKLRRTGQRVEHLNKSFLLSQEPGASTGAYLEEERIGNSCQ
jgi:hypothetical protein